MTSLASTHRPPGPQRVELTRIPSDDWDQHPLGCLLAQWPEDPRQLVLGGDTSALIHRKHDCFPMEAFLSWTPAQGHRKESKNPSPTAWLLNPCQGAGGVVAPYNAGWVEATTTARRIVLNLAGCWLSFSTITSLLQTIPAFCQACCCWVMGHMVIPRNFTDLNSPPYFLYHKMSLGIPFVAQR